MSVKLVVFDIAGTTVQDSDHSVSKAFQSALKQFGFEVALNNIDPLMGYEKTLAIKKILQENTEAGFSIPQKLVLDIHRVFVLEMIKHYQYAPDIAALPNVEETFLILHQMGIKIGINTGFSRDIADTILNRLNWIENGMVDFYVGSDEVLLGRPHPYMIEHLMQLCDINNPKEVVKVGDTEVDVREGQNANCLYSIGVTTGIFTRDELKKYKPSHIIDNVSELIPIFEAE